MHQAKAKCSSSDAEKALGLSDEGQWPSLEPLPLGREILSLTGGSGLFLGLWGVRRPAQGNGVTPPGLHGGCKEAMGSHGHDNHVSPLRPRWQGHQP